MGIIKNKGLNFIMLAGILILGLLLAYSLIEFNSNHIHTADAAINLSGAGTSSNPYKINNTSDLTTLANWVNSGNQCSGQYFELTNNIDASGVPVIGRMSYGTAYYFKGIFDGNGKSIRNLNISSNTTNNNGDIGLFGYLQGTVKNLIIMNGSINLTANGKSAGAIAGSTYSSTVIQNCFNAGCTVTASTGTGGSQTGGLVGYVAGNTTIRYCGNYASVTNNSNSNPKAGGILGIQGGGTATIDQCFNTGTISAGNTNSSDSYAGGISGLNGTIKNCYNTANITANAKTSTTNNTINLSVSDQKTLSSTGGKPNINIYSNNYSLSKQIKTAYSGGIVGSSNATVSNCYNTGKISGGKIRTTANNQFVFYFNTAATSAMGAGTVPGWTTIDTYTTTLYYDEIIYFSGINGNVTKSTINCYSPTTNKEDNFSYKIDETYDKDYDSLTMKDTYETTNWANISNSAYNTFSHDIGDFSFAGFLDANNRKIEVSTANDKVKLNFSYTLIYKEGKDDATSLSRSFNTIEQNITRTQNFTVKAETDMKVSSFANTLGSSYWGYNSLYNNGLPYLKNLFWTNSASRF